MRQVASRAHCRLTTWCYIPDDRTLHNHCCENLIPCIHLSIFFYLCLLIDQSPYTCPLELLFLICSIYLIPDKINIINIEQEFVPLNLNPTRFSWTCLIAYSKAKLKAITLKHLSQTCLHRKHIRQMFACTSLNIGFI
jgi:hypothetical protein